MKENELLKGIEEDEILDTLTENLIVARENAQSIKGKAERRQGQLLGKYNNYSNELEPPNTYDIDEIEKAMERVETREEIARKYIALDKVKKRSWTNEKKYREAMAKYYTYITPILTDLETAKHENRMKIAEINARYKKELAEARKEFNVYEDKVKELITIAGDISDYTYQVQYVWSRGGTARSDDFATSRAERYSKPVRFYDKATSFNQWGGHTQY